MDKEGISVSHAIKNNHELMIKLTSAGLLIAAANEKVNSYLLKHSEVFREMKEDEEAMALFNLYYEENEDELKKAAAESIFTSNEAEILLSNWRERDNGIEG